MQVGELGRVQNSKILGTSLTPLSSQRSTYGSTNYFAYALLYSGTTPKRTPLPFFDHYSEVSGFRCTRARMRACSQCPLQHRLRQKKAGLTAHKDEPLANDMPVSPSGCIHAGIQYSHRYFQQCSQHFHHHPVVLLQCTFHHFQWCSYCLASNLFIPNSNNLLGSLVQYCITSFAIVSFLFFYLIFCSYSSCSSACEVVQGESDNNGLAQSWINHILCSQSFSSI